MKNILFIHDYPLQEGGGVEIQTYQDATELVSRGFSVCILSSRTSSETYSINQKQVYPYLTEEGVELDCIYDLENLKKRIIHADIIHIQATFSMRPAMMSAMRMCVALKRNYIVTLHTNTSHIPFSALASMSSLEKNILLDEFKSLISNDLCTIVGVSESIAQSLAVLGISKKYESVYNAKNWRTFDVLSTTDIVKKVDITYVGEVSWMKGMHVFVSALTMLIKTNPKISVRIIGGGQDKKCVEALIDSLGISANVTFVSYVENKKLPTYLSSTSILVQPSLSETWGNIVMEALACEVTPIVSNTEGLVELVEGGRLGDVFDRGDAYDLFSKIIFRLRNPISEPKKREISEYIKSKYSIDSRIRHLLLVYRRIGIQKLKSRDKEKLIEFCSKID